MRSSVSVILSTPAPDTSMSHPDYEQAAHDHAALLILTKQLGEQLKPKTFSRILERISRVNDVKVVDSQGVTREVKARYIKEYPVENNDWGDYQTHRRLLGLVSVGKYENQQELNELCRLHETLKVKYSSTLFDSRCILISNTEGCESFSTPSNFKTRAIFYQDTETFLGLEENISEFMSSMFWVLESKRLERSREKIDRVSLLLAPFEKKDFVGLDLESRTNRKRCMGRMTKHLGDLYLQAGLPNESLGYYNSAVETLKAVNDWLWLGGALEGMCAASVVIQYPNLNRNYPLQRNASLQEGSPGKQRASVFTTNSLPAGITSVEEQQEAQNILLPEEILKRYREAIIHYSKYLNAGIIETEACFKAARVAVEQGFTLQAASFLQNVVFINLALTELEKIQRFLSLAELYVRIGFHRKASFCRRLAATRYVSPQNSQPNWGQCYQLMLQSLDGHALSLDPNEFPRDRYQGWPVLQIQLLQELVVAASRMGHSALATRHMTFLLQTLWKHLSSSERSDLARQLQGLTAQCEGAPVPLVLSSGVVVPPANLTNIPHVKHFMLQNLPAHLRPLKIEKVKEDPGPFLFTPIPFGSSLERKSAASRSKMDYLWVEGDTCEVSLELWNPLPFELKVSNMRLLTNGVVFESVPSSVSLPGDSGPHLLQLAGIPKEIGELELLGYSTHTLGVKSNCKLRNMAGFQHPHYSIDVVPALPQMQVSTSLPKSLSPNTNVDTAATGSSASISLYVGESAECTVTLSNAGQQSVEEVEVEIESTLDSATQQQVFQWSQDNLEAQLPLPAGASASLTIYLYSVADFLKPCGYSDGTLYGGSQSASYVSGPSSLPSRLGSPTWDRDHHHHTTRRSELTSSVRSGSSYRSGSSLGSSLFPLSKLTTPQTAKVLEGQIKLRYSGGPGLAAGYCRTCSVALSIEMLPSIQITNWDVLPAETNSQFYLVLDVANLTSHELELQYTPSKCILIEDYESCRVPVPVNRCPLSKLANLFQDGDAGEERGEVEAICSEHIASLVDLRWRMSNGEKSGRISLKGLTLSPEMLDVVRMSPLQWEVMVDSEPVKPQEELSCTAGQCLNLSISIHNFLERSLWHVGISVRFYQDHQNGVNNYRLETRLASAGASHIVLPELVEQGSAHHECNVVFFTPGQYKADIQCATQDNPSSDVQAQGAHIWKFIPPIAITVVDI